MPYPDAIQWARRNVATQIKGPLPTTAHKAELLCSPLPLATAPTPAPLPPLPHRDDDLVRQLHGPAQDVHHPILLVSPAVLQDDLPRRAEQPRCARGRQYRPHHHLAASHTASCSIFTLRISADTAQREWPRITLYTSTRRHPGNDGHVSNQGITARQGEGSIFPSGPPAACPSWMISDSPSNHGVPVSYSKHPRIPKPPHLVAAWVAVRGHAKSFACGRTHMHHHCEPRARVAGKASPRWHYTPCTPTATSFHAV